MYLGLSPDELPVVLPDGELECLALVVHVQVVNCVTEKSNLNEFSLSVGLRCIYPGRIRVNHGTYIYIMYYRGVNKDWSANKILKPGVSV